MADEQGEATPDAGESEGDIIADLASQAERAVIEQQVSRAEEREEPAGTDESERGEPEEEASDEVAEPTKAKAEHDPELSADARLSQAREAVESGDLEKAFLLAFGHKPEFFQVNPSKFTALRQQQATERAKTRNQAVTLANQQREFQSQVSQAVERLKPYERFYAAEQRFKQSGDSTELRGIIEGITGQSYDEAQKSMLHDVRRTPGEQRLQQQLEAMNKELADLKGQREQQSQQRTVEQQKEADLQVITSQLEGHEVAKVPNFKERVYRVLAKNYDPALGGLRITVADAAGAVLRGERKRVEASPLYRPPPAAEEPERRAAARPRGVTPTLRRGDSQSNGASTGEEELADIVSDIQGQIARQKMKQGAA